MAFSDKDISRLVRIFQDCSNGEVGRAAELASFLYREVGALGGLRRELINQNWGSYNLHGMVKRFLLVLADEQWHRCLHGRDLFCEFESTVLTRGYYSRIFRPGRRLVGIAAMAKIQPAELKEERRLVMQTLLISDEEYMAKVLACAKRYVAKYREGKLSVARDLAALGASTGFYIEDAGVTPQVFQAWLHKADAHAARKCLEYLHSKSLFLLLEKKDLLEQRIQELQSLVDFVGEHRRISGDTSGDWFDRQRFVTPSDIGMTVADHEHLERLIIECQHYILPPRTLRGGYFFMRKPGIRVPGK